MNKIYRVNNTCWLVNEKQHAYAIIDEEDIERLLKFQWYRRTDGYFATHDKRTNSTIFMHRYIIRLNNKHFVNKSVDHINGIRNDNRKSNLRAVTSAFNSSMLAHVTRNKHSDLPRGVYKKCEKYCVLISRAIINEKRFYKGNLTLDEATELAAKMIDYINDRYEYLKKKRAKLKHELKIFFYKKDQDYNALNKSILNAFKALDKDDELAHGVFLEYFILETKVRDICKMYRITPEDVYNLHNYAFEFIADYALSEV